MAIESRWDLGDEIPDQSFLQDLHRADQRTSEAILAVATEACEVRLARREPLLRAVGIPLDEMLREDEQRSRRALELARAYVSDPPVDFGPVHEAEDALMRPAGQRSFSTEEPWFTHLSPVGSGSWSYFSGGAEDEPRFEAEMSALRFNLFAEAHGGGKCSIDFADIHGYVFFRFGPPDWCSVNFLPHPLTLHGWYSIYASDDWWTDAMVKVESWIDVHQHFWRPRQYVTHFALGGGDFHPSQFARIDEAVGPGWYGVSLGPTDAVTIRVGVHLHVRAKASGSHARLDFLQGAANFIHAPMHLLGWGVNLRSR